MDRIRARLSAEGQVVSLSIFCGFPEVRMSRPGLFTWMFTLGVAACVLLACGSPARQVQSITLSPATADAQNYPNGQVPFLATGYYNSAPTTVSPLQANWGAASGSLPANGAVTIDANGVAQCSAGASGTYTIGAWVNLPVKGTPPCPLFPYGTASCSHVLGTAKLTCP